jgi:hypothetical protein
MLLIACIVSSCKSKVNTQLEPTIVYTHHLIEPIVEGFIKCMANYNVDNDSTIRISFSSKADTVTMFVANAYPVANENYHGFTKVNDSVTVFFVDEYKREFYVVKNNAKLPEEVIKMQRTTPKRIHPIYWEFYFKDTILIDYRNKKMIDTFVNLSK